ncbi:MAG: hypothetical protein ACOVQL_09005, partial [Limnohabitans sp.]
GLEPARLAAGDFESPASTNFTTRAADGGGDYDTGASGAIQETGAADDAENVALHPLNLP